MKNQSPLNRPVLLAAFALQLLAMSPYAMAQVDSGPIEQGAPEARVQENTDRLTIQVGKTQYTVKAPENGLENFNALPEDEKAIFRKNRVTFLAQAAKALQLMKYGFGIGSVTKEKISFVFRHLRDERAMNKIAELPPEIKEEALSARDRTLELRLQETEKRAQETFKQRSTQVVESFLNALDKNLWSQALLFAHSNEFGIVASGGLELLGGLQNKGGWGGLFDIGISIGYNRDTKAVAIQIFRDFERFKSTSMKAVFMAGAIGKLGMYIANQRTGEMKREGTSFYPPMVPAYSSTTPSLFQSGMSTGLTWPPSPLGDMLTYTNSLDNKVLLRITLSPILKGFVRLETGLNRDSFKFFITPVLTAIQFIKKSVGLKLRETTLNCAGVFAG